MKALMTTVLFVLVAGTVLAADPIGMVLALQGTASAVGTDGQTRELALKGPIYLKDKVVTAAGAKLQIIFDDDSVISQGEKSEMLIDEYVYSPAKKEDNNLSVKLTKGAFRVITGKITKLNPERFKVRTRMATIGIRGCDLGFTVTQVGDHIYVIALDGMNETITIEAKAPSGGKGEVGQGEWALLMSGQVDDPKVGKQHLINVTQPNRVVSITINGLDVRPITSAELVNLIESVTPDVTPEGAGTGTDTGAGTGTGTGTGTEGTGGTGTDLGAGTGTETDGTTGDGSTTDGTMGGTTGTGDPTTGSTVGDVVDGAALDTQTDTAAETLQDAVNQLPGETGSTGPVITYTPHETHTYWEYGVWDTDGVIDKVDFYKNSTLLSAADAQKIMDDLAQYTLVGSGTAAAIINGDGLPRLISGTCSLDVLIGGGTVNFWNGSFTMQGAPGDTLDFSVDGTILPGGVLTGNQTAYDLYARGVHYPRHTITSEQITGHLVGPPGATVPAGSVGSYNFVHGTGPSVNGGWGVDLVNGAF